MKVMLKKCPICKAKNVTVAHVLGHAGRGVPKTLSQAERKRMAQRLATRRYRGGRKPGATNLATRSTSKTK